MEKQKQKASEMMKKCIERAEDAIKEKDKTIKKLKKKVEKLEKQAQAPPVLLESSALNKTALDLSPEKLQGGKQEDFDALSAINATSEQQKPAKSELNKSFERTARSISTAGANKYF